MASVAKATGTKEYMDLRRSNNKREQELLKRLSHMTEDDCRISEIKDNLRVLHSLIKRAGDSAQLHTDSFGNSLNRSKEYFEVINQYRRMQAHKMTRVLDYTDAECKGVNQVLDDHFDSIREVYSIIRPDITTTELFYLTCTGWVKALWSVVKSSK